MKVLLVSPPIGNFAQVHPAICLLTRYLRQHGQHVIQKDLSIDCFHYFHSSLYLHSLLSRVSREIEVEIEPGQLSHNQASLVSRKVRLSLLLEWLVRSIDEAKEQVHSSPVLDSPEDLARFLKVIRNVGRAISAAHPGQEFSFQTFRSSAAFDDWNNLRDALDNRARNLLLPFIENLDLPRADLLGISVTYPAQLLPSLCIANAWRKSCPAGRIVLGGSYVSVMAETWNDPRWFDLFNYLVMNDGEEPLRQLAEGQKGPSEIPNLLYREGTTVRKSSSLWKASLRDLPVPMLDFNGLVLERYVTPHLIVPLPISRGCYWGKCTFCNISNQVEDRYRVRPADLIVEDIRHLQKSLNTPYFDFCIDSFHPRGLADISQSLVSAKLKIFWNAEVLLDPEFTRERLQHMSESGCRHLRFGLESVNLDTLAIMNKRNDMNVVRRILSDCCDFSIKVSLMSIVGFPTETREGADRTLQFYIAEKEKISFVTLHQFNISAGSPLMHNPNLAGVELKRRPGLLQPSFEYENRNAKGMSPREAAETVAEMEKAVREHYPQHAEIHTVGIGGWLTFLACCRHDSQFFKRPIRSYDIQEHYKPESPRGGIMAYGGFGEFRFDVAELERMVSKNNSWNVRRVPCCVVMNPDEKQIHVFPAVYVEWLRLAYSGRLSEVPEDFSKVLQRLGVTRRECLSESSVENARIYSGAA